MTTKERQVILMMALVGGLASCGTDADETAAQAEVVQQSRSALTNAAASNPAMANAVRSVRPVVKCVDQLGGGRVAAHFGYVNRSAATVSIPVGPFNAFLPPPANRGQPAVFDENSVVGAAYRRITGRVMGEDIPIPTFEQASGGDLWTTFKRWMGLAPAREVV